MTAQEGQLASGASCSVGTDEPAVPEPWFKALADGNPDLVLVIGRAGNILLANPAARQTLGLVDDMRPGLNVADLVHPQDRERAEVAWLREPLTARSRQPSAFRFRAAGRDWRVLDVVASNFLDYPGIGGIVLGARDITERANLSRALATLGQCNQVLVRAADEGTLLRETCRTIVDAGGYPLAWVGYADHDEAQTIRPVASAGHATYLDDLSLSWGIAGTGQGPTGTAIRTGDVQMVKDSHRSRRFKLWRERVEQYGFRTTCALPLTLGGQTVGALVIYANEPGAFDPAALELLRQLADDLGYGIGRLRDACSLQASEERFRLLADEAPIGILESWPGGGVKYANPWVAETCGRSVESLLGSGWAQVIHPEDLADVIAHSNQARPIRAKVSQDFRIVRPDGEPRLLRVHAVPKGQHPDQGRVMTIQDITEEVLSREKLAHQAFYDTLTGLPNRALFLDRLGQELARGRRTSPDIAVLFLDLDRFKVVNDGLGHAAGDTVLQEVGRRFSGTVRAGETAARFSGDEFIFIIRDVEGTADAVAAAGRLLKALEAPVHCGGQDFSVTGSIGIVVPGPGAEAAAVLRGRRHRYVPGEGGGQDRYAIFDDDLHNRSVARLALEADLGHALARHELEVYYQPVLEPASEHPIGAEALLRWHHPVRGLVSPLEFIPVAEESGLIKAIGRFVLDRAMAQLAEWDRHYRGPHLDVMAVNLSARQLDDDGTSAMVRDLLDRYGIATQRVSLELTESAAMADSAGYRRTLRDFKAHGFRVGGRRLRDGVFLVGLPPHPAGDHPEGRPLLRRATGH